MQGSWQAWAAELHQLGMEPEKLRLLMLWLFTGSCALQDVWKKEIRLVTYLIFTIIGGITACVYPLEPFAFLLGLLPGIGLLLLVRLLPGSIGGGDALYFLTAAFYWPLKSLAALLLLSVCLSGIAALGLFVKSVVSGPAAVAMQETEDSVSPRKQTLPYLCFVLLALWLLTS